MPRPTGSGSAPDRVSQVSQPLPKGWEYLPNLNPLRGTNGKGAADLALPLGSPWGGKSAEAAPLQLPNPSSLRSVLRAEEIQYPLAEGPVAVDRFIIRIRREVELKGVNETLASEQSDRIRRIGVAGTCHPTDLVRPVGFTGGPLLIISNANSQK